MSTTLIRNVSTGPVGLPAPFHGILAAGKIGTVLGSVSSVIAALGGDDKIVGVLACSPGGATDVADPALCDPNTQYVYPVADPTQDRSAEIQQAVNDLNLLYKQDLVRRQLVITIGTFRDAVPVDVPSGVDVVPRGILTTFRFDFAGGVDDPLNAGFRFLGQSDTATLDSTLSVEARPGDATLTITGTVPAALLGRYVRLYGRNGDPNTGHDQSNMSDGTAVLLQQIRKVTALNVGGNAHKVAISPPLDHWASNAANSTMKIEAYTPIVDASIGDFVAEGVGRTAAAAAACAITFKGTVGCSHGNVYRAQGFSRCVVQRIACQGLRGGRVDVYGECNGGVFDDAAHDTNWWEITKDARGARRFGTQGDGSVLHGAYRKINRCTRTGGGDGTTGAGGHILVDGWGFGMQSWGGLNCFVGSISTANMDITDVVLDGIAAGELVGPIMASCFMGDSSEPSFNEVELGFRFGGMSDRNATHSDPLQSSVMFHDSYDCVGGDILCDGQTSTSTMQGVSLKDCYVRLGLITAKGVTNGLRFWDTTCSGSASLSWTGGKDSGLDTNIALALDQIGGAFVLEDVVINNINSTAVVFNWGLHFADYGVVIKRLTMPDGHVFTNNHVAFNNTVTNPGEAEYMVLDSTSPVGKRYVKVPTSADDPDAVLVTLGGGTLDTSAHKFLFVSLPDGLENTVKVNNDGITYHVGDNISLEGASRLGTNAGNRTWGVCLEAVAAGGAGATAYVKVGPADVSVANAPSKAYVDAGDAAAIAASEPVFTSRAWDPVLTMDHNAREVVGPAAGDVFQVIAPTGHVAGTTVLVSVPAGHATNYTPAPDLHVTGDAFDAAKDVLIVYRYDGTTFTGTMKATTVREAVAPTISSIVGERSNLTITFAEAVWLPSLLGLSLTFSAGTPVTIASIASGNGTATVVMALSAPLDGTETFTFDVAVGRTLQDLNGNLIATGTHAVDNNSYPVFANEIGFWRGDSVVTGAGPVITQYLDKTGNGNTGLPANTAWAYVASDATIHRPVGEGPAGNAKDGYEIAAPKVGGVDPADYTEYTVIVVAKKAASNEGVLLDSADVTGVDGTGPIMFFSNFPKVFFGCGSFANAAASAALNGNSNWHAYVGIHTGPERHLLQDNIQIATNVVADNPNAIRRITLGYDVAVAGGLPYMSRIAEWRLIGHALTAPELATLAAYMTQRYGL